MDLRDIVDLDRYPIDQPASAAFDELVTRCRQQLAERGCCVLDNFVSSGAVRAMVDATDGLRAHRRCEQVRAWGDPAPSDFPADHVHRRLFDQDIAAIGGDQFGETHPLRKLYQNDDLAFFLAAALGLDHLYRFVDPFQDLNVIKINDGGVHAWHYDLSDFVVTLLLQKPHVGGEFEFVPFVRGELLPGVVGGRDGRVWDERYDEVERVLDGRSPNVHTLALEPGTLVLFNGLRSLHRVRPVQGSTPRMVGVLSYDTKPGFCSTPAINARLYGDRVPEG